MRPEVRAAAARLAGAGVVSPDSDAVTLLAHVLGVEAAEVRRQMVLGGGLTPEQRAVFADLVGERCRRLPLQHLTGVAYFRRLRLAVGPGVFIPRPETEVTVELALQAVRPGLRVVDLCTGTGAIALAIKDEAPAAEVHAVELSEHALAWARLNQQALGLDVRIVSGDARTALPELDGRVDVVVSNPPYIPVGLVPTEPEVHEHDPALALYGGSEDGLALPLAVAERAADLLRSGGTLVMEHAGAQGSSLPAALRRSRAWHRVRDHHDLNDRPRVVVAVRR